MPAEEGVCRARANTLRAQRGELPPVYREGHQGCERLDSEPEATPRPGGRISFRARSPCSLHRTFLLILSERTRRLHEAHGQLWQNQRSPGWQSAWQPGSVGSREAEEKTGQSLERRRHALPLLRAAAPTCQLGPRPSDLCIIYVSFVFSQSHVLSKEHTAAWEAQSQRRKAKI